MLSARCPRRLIVSKALSRRSFACAVIDIAVLAGCICCTEPGRAQDPQSGPTGPSKGLREQGIFEETSRVVEVSDALLALVDALIRVRIDRRTQRLAQREGDEQETGQTRHREALLSRQIHPRAIKFDASA